MHLRCTDRYKTLGYKNVQIFTCLEYVQHALRCWNPWLDAHKPNILSPNKNVSYIHSTLTWFVDSLSKNIFNYKRLNPPLKWKEVLCHLNDKTWHSICSICHQWVWIKFISVKRNEWQRIPLNHVYSMDRHHIIRLEICSDSARR